MSVFVRGLRFLSFVAALGVVLATPEALAQPRRAPGDAEARLVEVQRRLAAADLRQAIAQAEALLRDYPEFALARLVYADALAMRSGAPAAVFNDAPPAARVPGQVRLDELRGEAHQRGKALRERPPAGAVPAEFIQLAPDVRHAIAVDTSRSRLYVLRNSGAGLRVVSDHYVSVGRAGTDKSAEGDLRTPLGVYHVTSKLDIRTLTDFYGSGALPINYPNAYDTLRGRTGSGIWLHGTPPDQFARAPLATDGCIAIPNPDMASIAALVEAGRTPVVIARELRWVSPAQAQARSADFHRAFSAWQGAKGRGDVASFMAFYADDFRPAARLRANWRTEFEREARASQGRGLQFKDVSVLQWRDAPGGQDLVVTYFGEVPVGQRTGRVKRQYWMQTSAGWKILFEETTA